jgi:hypothetical protein
LTFVEIRPNMNYEYLNCYHHHRKSVMPILMNTAHGNKLKITAVLIGYAFLSIYPCMAGEVTIFTPRKTQIRAYTFTELPPDAIDKKDKEFEKMINDNKWSATILKSSSSKYNSHGFAWHVNRGGAQVVIDGKDVSQYWLDGSYRQIQKTEARKGDIIFMTDPLKPGSYHSALVTQPGWCQSKWDDGPLVLHKHNEHPFGKEIKFFRRNRPAAPSNLRIVQ